jgi:hypothetical protein
MLNDKMFWSLFEQLGSVEAYLAYKRYKENQANFRGIVK